MINFGNFTSLFDIAINFDTPAKCRAAIAQSRWPDGDVVCPYCGRHRCHLRKDGRYTYARDAAGRSPSPWGRYSRTRR